ncbi:MAG: SDR family oxidoreductase [bacterium]|nr:SDR family oxidoreductase [bacterium]MDE0667438.1 SDR family oxidoreductase [bacterium]MXZ31540.1 SDR family oxidoreductase [Acidimicrobiia bacterium]MYJ13882.1 SDR family oxidoreductase [Acidimicrobiia bacterium]
MSDEHFLITGAMGCIGAWAVRQLAQEGVEMTLFDISTDDKRLRLIVDADDLAVPRRIQGDLTVTEQVLAAAEGATHIVHLGALQVPTCRADPPLGAAINVVGTANVFEAAQAHGIRNLVYTSSVAVFGPPEAYDTDRLPNHARRAPTTHYGVYKVANEDTAKVYWHENGIPSVGLRPHTVYGPGRDQGVTSYPCRALLAAVRGQRYHIEYGGWMDFQHASDVARTAIAAARAEPGGCDVYNISGSVATVASFVEAIIGTTDFAGITCGTNQLPFPRGLDDSALEARLGAVSRTPLAEGVAQTADWFRAAIADGRPLPPP